MTQAKSNLPRSTELGPGPRQPACDPSLGTSGSQSAASLTATRHPLGEGKDVAEVPMVQRAAPTARDSLAPNIGRAGARKPQTWGGLLFQAPHSTRPLSSLRSFTCL